MAVREEFKSAMLSGNGCAVIIAGSDSDKEHIQQIEKSLQKYGIPYDIRICSVHKQPGKLVDLIRDYNEVEGLVAYVAVAGGTDALSGTLSYHVFGPVISSPPDGRNLSCLSNPPGSSNAYIERPENVGRFIAQIYSGVNKNLRDKLRSESERKISALEAADLAFQKVEDNRG